MAAIEGSAQALIDASPAACLAVLEDFERYPEWQELIDETRVVQRDAEGRATEVEAVTRLAVKTFRYRLAYERAGGRLAAHRVSGDFKRIELEWRVEEAPGGGSAVSYTLAGDAGWALDRLLAPVRDAAGREMIDDVVAGLKARVER